MSALILGWHEETEATQSREIICVIGIWKSTLVASWTSRCAKITPRNLCYSWVVGRQRRNLTWIWENSLLLIAVLCFWAPSSIDWRCPLDWWRSDSKLSTKLNIQYQELRGPLILKITKNVQKAPNNQGTRFSHRGNWSKVHFKFAIEGILKWSKSWTISYWAAKNLQWVAELAVVYWAKHIATIRTKEP